MWWRRSYGWSRGWRRSGSSSRLGRVKYDCRPLVFQQARRQCDGGDFNAFDLSRGRFEWITLGYQMLRLFAVNILVDEMTL